MPGSETPLNESLHHIHIGNSQVQLPGVNMCLSPLELMVDSFDALTISDLDQLEQDLNISLPPSYREFLLRHNGGRFVDSVVYRVPGTDDYRSVSCFYSVGADDELYDLSECASGKLS